MPLHTSGRKSTNSTNCTNCTPTAERVSIHSTVCTFVCTPVTERVPIHSTVSCTFVWSGRSLTSYVTMHKSTTRRVSSSRNWSIQTASNYCTLPGYRASEKWLKLVLAVEVCMCVCVCVCVCLHACECVHACTCMHGYVCVCVLQVIKKAVKWCMILTGFIVF